jgi:putative tricarboxylic transport membrane protein
MAADASQGGGAGRRLLHALPYLVLLAVTVGLWTVSGRIDYPARPGSLGPDFWPRAAILLMGALCVGQIVKLFVLGPVEARGLGDRLDEEEDDGEAPRRPLLLLGGVALTVGYAFSLGTLGFPLATALFLVAFMYLGGSRRHLAIWLSSLVGVALVCVLLLKVVYVSLPRGVAPFDRIVDFITGL